MNEEVHLTPIVVIGLIIIAIVLLALMSKISKWLIKFEDRLLYGKGNKSKVQKQTK